MFDIGLFVNLLLHSFSFKKNSLRFPTFRRVICVLTVLPFFLILIIINRMFMLLDWIIFPRFWKTNIEKSCFIIGVPRSATTYLLNILAKDKEQFTCFKLWEILFAPSIIQKYILLGFINVDRLIGRPLYHVSKMMDKLLLGKIARLHETGFAKPEEDEMLLMYVFGTLYLAFFFPEVKALDSHLFFDEEVADRKRKNYIIFYRRCVQRHAYVFNRSGKKFFLSKSPCFICKTATIGKVFPKARMLYMLRSPLKTIPSAISLNLNVYSIFSGRRTENPLAVQTSEAVMRWYRMAEDSLMKHWQERNMFVPFRRITKHPANTIKSIYQYLNIVPSVTMEELLDAEEINSAKYKSSHKYVPSPFPDEVINSRLSFIFDGSYYLDI